MTDTKTSDPKNMKKEETDMRRAQPVDKQEGKKQGRGEEGRLRRAGGVRKEKRVRKKYKARENECKIGIIARKHKIRTPQTTQQQDSTMQHTAKYIISQNSKQSTST